MLWGLNQTGRWEPWGSTPFNLGHLSPTAGGNRPFFPCVRKGDLPLHSRSKTPKKTAWVTVPSEKGKEKSRLLLKQQAGTARLGHELCARPGWEPKKGRKGMERLELHRLSRKYFCLQLKDRKESMDSLSKLRARKAKRSAPRGQASAVLRYGSPRWRFPKLGSWYG